MFPLIRRVVSSVVANSSFRNNVRTVQSSAYIPQSELDKAEDNRGPKKFLKNNRKVYAPQTANETPRPAFVCHLRENIKYSPDKMWYIASMVRGLTVDEAVRQLRFCNKGCAPHLMETILEAQEMAVRDHNVEFKSNLWVAESFVGKGIVIKGIRRHARRRVGHVEYKYSHYFVRLEEGTPPKDYYGHDVTPEEQLNKWLSAKRLRKVYNSL